MEAGVMTAIEGGGEAGRAFGAVHAAVRAARAAVTVARTSKGGQRLLESPRLRMLLLALSEPLPLRLS